MITESEYLKAKAIVEQYEREQMEQDCGNKDCRNTEAAKKKNEATKGWDDYLNGIAQDTSVIFP